MASKQQDQTIFLFMNPQSILSWEGWLAGPEDSPFKDHFFKISIQMTYEYPIKPPCIRFATRIFHPNIHWETGEICIEVLKEQWSPHWTLESVCRAILFLLSNPNPDSPLNCDAGNMLRNNDSLAYETTATMYTHEYGIHKETIAI